MEDRSHFKISTENGIDTQSKRLRGVSRQITLRNIKDFFTCASAAVLYNFPFEIEKLFYRESDYGTG